MNLLKTSILLFFFTISIASIANKIDSLKSEIDFKNNEAWISVEVDINKSYELAYWSSIESNKISYGYGLSRSNLTLGLIALQTGDIQLALERTLIAKNEAKKDSLKALVYNQLGRVYLQLYDLEQSKSNFEAAIKINRALGLKKNLQGNYINYGNYKDVIQEIDSANYYFIESYNIAQELKDTLGLIASLNNLAGITGALGSLSEEQEYYYEILKLTPKKSVQRAKIYGNISTSFFQQEKYKKANLYSDSSLSVAKEINFLQGLKFIYNQKSIIEEELGNYEAALNYQKKSSNYREQFINESTHKKITQIQLSNEFEHQLKLDSVQKAKEVAILEKENERKELLRMEQIKKRNLFIYFGLAFILVIAYVAYKLYKVGVERRKANEIISEQKVEVEQQRDIAKQEHALAEEQKKIVEDKNTEILESITYAKRLQEAILPPQKLVKEWLTESFIYYKPKDIVAGDFYWMETAQREDNGIKKTLVYFAAADCTGHGVPGAMVSVVCANALNRAVKEFKLRDPGKILDKVTDLVIESFEKSEEEIKDGMDLALCALDISSQKLYYAGANNPLWIVSKKEELKTEAVYKSLSNKEGVVHLHEVKASKQPVGQFYNRTPFATNTIQLEGGDEVFISSDGFPDQFGGEKGKKYKSLNFKRFLLEIYHNEVETQKDLLSKEFESWKGEQEQVDDVCVIGVQVSELGKGLFTNREFEVVKYVAQGLSSKMIADKMDISKHTVDTHRRRVLAKTNTHNAAELIKYCQEIGVV